MLLGNRYGCTTHCPTTFTPRATVRRSKLEVNAYRYLVYDSLQDSYVGNKQAVIMFRSFESANDMRIMCTKNDVRFVRKAGESSESHVIWSVKKSKLRRPRHLLVRMIIDECAFVQYVRQQGMQVFDVTFLYQNSSQLIGELYEFEYDHRTIVDMLEKLLSEK